MSTLSKRYSFIETNLDKAKDFYLNIEGFNVIIEFTLHSQKRGQKRRIYDNTVITMVRSGFYDIIELRNHEKFILSSYEFGVSLIGEIMSVGGDIVIKLVTSIDSPDATNPYGTPLIVI